MAHLLLSLSFATAAQPPARLLHDVPHTECVRRAPWRCEPRGGCELRGGRCRARAGHYWIEGGAASAEVGGWTARLTAPPPPPVVVMTERGVVMDVRFGFWRTSYALRGDAERREAWPWGLAAVAFCWALPAALWFVL